MYKVNKKVLRESKTQVYIISNLIDKLLFIDDLLKEKDNKYEQLSLLKFIYSDLLQQIDGDLFYDLKDEAYTVIYDRVKEILKDEKIIMNYIEENDDWTEHIFEMLGI